MKLQRWILVVMLLGTGALAQAPRYFQTWRASKPEVLERNVMAGFNGWIAPGATGSWADVNNWSLGVVPVVNDDVAFGTWSQADVIDGFAQGAVGLASLWTQPEYGGNIGSAANALVLDGTTKLRHEGSGLLSIKYDGSGGIIIIDSPNRDLAAIIDGNAPTCIINVKRGVVELAAGLSEIDDLHVSYQYSPGDDAVVMIAPSANAIGQMTVNGGIVTNYRNVNDGAADEKGNLSIGGGQVFMEGTAAVTSKVVMFGGFLANNSTGVWVNTTLHGGQCDTTQKSGTRQMTTVTVHEGAAFKYNEDLITATIRDYRNEAPR